ncbi:hypothetical protein [Rhodococcus sp. IEGM1428]|uniref:hypothetical protein n=1 Tax=Rhodococcus sp. IEGM1428 TaxID=3392191 RepID=UPI003D0A280F
MDRLDEPLFTDEIYRRQFAKTGGTFIFGNGVDEDRASVASEWHATTNFTDVNFISIDAQGNESVLVTEVDAASAGLQLFLHDADDIVEYLQSLPGPITLDITALAHRTWAPLLRAAVIGEITISLIYLEPETYSSSRTISEDGIYDLSEKIGGIEPIPGFARLGPGSTDEILVPMIGFEGTRLNHILSRTETPPDRIVPIVGVPGFRPEYSFYAHSRNRSVIEANFVYRQVQFAKANCPFDAFLTLSEVHAWNPHEGIRVAPIGTKPHAVGAVLYAISRGNLVEIVYDHPVRSKRRSKGEARLCVYDITGFVNTSVFRFDDTNGLSGHEDS